MKTNYGKLNSFEAATVFVAVVGLGLFGWEIFYALPVQHQVAVAESVAIFDIHEQSSGLFDASLNSVQMVFSISDEVFEQFALAFAQTFSYPQMVGEPALQLASELEVYSQSVAANYERNNFVASTATTDLIATAFAKVENADVAIFDFSPRVAGAITHSPAGYDCVKEEIELSIPYSYQIPKMLQSLNY